eukprot:Gregarina_sp_Pseudo_9__5498@NODE_709_length_2327_cov_49_110140_g479_i1_p1_GENE_NODE_709_length_2327_cov_49_110140_g479_i1NODE_709_length_2327_cov_49_110140_g479_i1_p1_ORF_typecomplete_len287_score34_25AhpCTSA/PF00578_21/1_9e25Redoxin/PF08534_10/8_3e15SCO1SenC/PF02630_14/0_028_NODE_709_length_2327_cov_49_110140_g479_i112742134
MASKENLALLNVVRVKETAIEAKHSSSSDFCSESTENDDGNFDELNLERGASCLESPIQTRTFSSDFPCLSVRQPAPYFCAEAVFPPHGDIANISLLDFRGRYLLLVFYPHDFTFVCPTELLTLNRRYDSFKRRGIAVLACSVDSAQAHVSWCQTPITRGGVGTLKFPLLADLDTTICRAYGCYSAEMDVALRGLYLIDRKGVLRHKQISDLNIGRNFEEVYRVACEMLAAEKKGVDDFLGMQTARRFRSWLPPSRIASRIMRRSISKVTSCGVSQQSSFDGLHSV